MFSQAPFQEPGCGRAPHADRVFMMNGNCKNTVPLWSLGHNSEQSPTPETLDMPGSEDECALALIPDTENKWLKPLELQILITLSIHPRHEHVMGGKARTQAFQVHACTLVYWIHLPGKSDFQGVVKGSALLSEPSILEYFWWGFNCSNI